MVPSLIWIGIGCTVASLIAAFAAVAFLSQRLKDRAKDLEDFKAQILEWNRRMEAQVAERNKDLDETQHQLQTSYLETVTALLEAMNAKDPYLFDHSNNVTLYASAVAEEMGFSPGQIKRMSHGCELHDLGKIAIPDSILLKKGPLTNEEFEVVKQHPIWGSRILEPLTFMRDITEMVLQEHERWDGTGYPMGLKGEQIRLEARIIAVADALDAMTSQRPYRQPISLEQSAQELSRCSGTQFDPVVVEATVKVIREKKLTLPAHPHRHAVSH